MIALGRPKGAGRNDLRHNRLMPAPGFLGASLRAEGFFTLAIVLIEDRRAVLRAGVVALPVGSRGIVNAEKEIEKRAIAQDVGVKRDSNRLGMPGPPGADVLVSGALECPAGV